MTESLIIPIRVHLHDIYKQILEAAVCVPADVGVWQCVCTWTRVHSLIHGRVVGSTENVPDRLLGQMRNWHIIRVHGDNHANICVTAQKTFYELCLYDCGATLTDVTCKHLTLGSTHVCTSSIPQVASLTILDHCDYVSLSHLTSITHLSIRHSSLDCDLTMLTTLTSLDIDNIDEVDVVTILPAMPNLLRLRADIDVADLKRMTALTRLNAPVTDVSSLGSIRSLTDISMRNPTRHSAYSTLTISSLLNMPIKILRIYNPVEDFLNIYTLTQLQQLHIYRRVVAQVYIRHLTQLHTLTIWGSSTTANILPLLTNLTSLTIVNNLNFVTKEIIAKLPLLTNLQFTSHEKVGE